MRLNPRARVTVLVSLIVGLGFLCAGVALWTARQIDETVSIVVERTLPSVVAASELQNALHEQRGIVSAFMLENGHRAWINDLDRNKPKFTHWLGEARRSAQTNEERRVLDLLEQVYAEYDRQRETVISLYQGGEKDRAREVLLRDVAALADQCRSLCHDLVDINQQTMNLAIISAHQRVGRLTLMVGSGLAVAMIAAVALLLLVIREVLIPVQKLARDAREFAPFGSAPAGGAGFRNDLGELEFYSRAIMSDVTRTREHLAESQQRLVRAEGMAAVGRSAASAAHEIRNPLAAMKIWLYELQRSIAGDDDARDTCAILAGEIGRLEGLAQDFLERSRPRDLHMVRQNLHVVVQRSLALAEPQLRGKQQRAIALNGTLLPDVVADGDQIHQALLNLLTNAVEATPCGGEIRVSESLEPGAEGASEVVVRVADNGPGIPDEIRDRLFEPFTTTKANGTGLGLSIAAEILKHHGGSLVLESSTPAGSQFALRLPACQD